MSTYSMPESPDSDHPESWYAHRKRAEGHVRVGLPRQAIAVLSHEAGAYRVLGGRFLQQGRRREAHRVVLAGLARHGPDRQLWAFLPASYVAKGDLEAATRALEAIVVSGKGLAEDEGRLAELLEAMS